MQAEIASQERNWGVAAHLSALVAVAGMPFGHILGPLVVYLIKGNESEFVAGHARASLNYQITVSIAMVVGIIVAVAATLGFIATNPDRQVPDPGSAVSFGVFLFAVGIAFVLAIVISLIFIIMGSLAASEGRPYTYPFAIRFLK
jgi:uncharacterized protein